MSNPPTPRSARVLFTALKSRAEQAETKLSTLTTALTSLVQTWERRRENYDSCVAANLTLDKCIEEAGAILSTLGRPTPEPR